MQDSRKTKAQTKTEGVFWAKLPGDGIAMSEAADVEATLARCMRDLQVTDCNSQFASFYGLSSSQECIGMPLRDFFKSQSSARSCLKKILTEGRILHTLERTNEAGMSIRVVMLSHVIQQKERLIGIQGINIEQTNMDTCPTSHLVKDLRSAEAHQQKADLLLDAIDQSGNCIILLDLAGTIIYANPAKAKFVGRSKDELFGVNASAFAVRGQEQLERDMEFTTLKNGAWSGELLRRRFDGVSVLVHMKTSLIHNSRGEPIAQLRTFYDMSAQEELRAKIEGQSDNLRHMVAQRTGELLQSEKTFRFWYENSPVGTVITTLEGIIVEANPAACALLKCPREKLLNKNLGGLFRYADQYRKLISSLSSKIKTVDEEIEYQTGDEGFLAIRQSSVRIESGDSNTLAIHFLEDVTHEKELAREAEDTRRQIARAGKLASLGQLVAGVAHELNNPLTAVLTYAHLLRKRVGEGEELNRQLNLIVEAGERCRQIVRDLLDFARERASTRIPVNMNDIIVHVLEMIQNQVLIQKVTVEKRLQRDLPAIRVDRHRIEQVFVNICMNAIEAMPEGGTLHVTNNYDPAANLIAITFRDSGIGIPKKRHEKIFDPFFTTKAPGTGTGLGLAISHRFISDHGGHIHVESEIGKGSQFTVELPAKTEADDLWQEAEHADTGGDLSH
ncbi:MAG: PAS domain S-box protein [Planctomycetes bacterium]|nr:PAS domain S-box protein [Planctomycetota bacterium]